MPRDTDTVPVTQDKHGNDVHPAFGHVQVSLVSSTPGQVLFDSDVRHGDVVVLRVATATRSRSNNHDYIHGGKVLTEVAFSRAQWAALVSSFGSSGVPATLQRTEQGETPGLEYEPRLAITMQENREAAQRAFQAQKDALEAYEALLVPSRKASAKEKAEALRWLRACIANATPNVDFAGKTLVKHAEAVVAKAKGDIEATVQREVTRLKADGQIAPGFVTLDTLAGGSDPRVIEG